MVSLLRHTGIYRGAQMQLHYGFAAATLTAFSTAFSPLPQLAHTFSCGRVQRPATVETASSIMEISKLDERDAWVTSTVPQSIDQIAMEAQDSLAAALTSGVSSRWRVDIRTPGLDDAFEETAIRNKGLLLGILEPLFSVLAGRRAKVLFESEGEAAMATKAYGRGDFNIPESTSFAGLKSRSVEPEDEIVMIVEPRNRVGDVVILEIERILQEFPKATYILFNPELESKGAIGIRERDRRQAILDSFDSAYMYICLATMSRPDLIPMEIGAMHFQFGKGKYRLLRTLLPPEDDGPGSLNRFFHRPIYGMTPVTPTAENPPRMYVVAEYDSRPAGADASDAMAQSRAVLASMMRSVSEAVLTEEEARSVLIEAADKRSVDPTDVVRAIDFLERNNRRTQREKGGGDDESGELRRRIGGTWRLIFTTGTKGTQAQIGSLNYVPIKAQQYFSPTDDGYSNIIYLGSWPAVQVLGTYGIKPKKRLDFYVKRIKLGPFQIGQDSSGFFTFFYVDDAIAVARGQGGGLAFWRKVK